MTGVKMTESRSVPADEEMRAGAREWAGLAVLMLPCLVVSMNSNVLNLALPQITADLRPTSVQLLWIVDGYGYLLAGALITMGVLGDRIGRRRLLLTGGAAFAIGSVAGASATSAGMLIASRMVLGIAGATLMPSTLSLIRSMFGNPRQRTVALGVWTASFALGGVIAPIIGGVLLNRFWWGSVFLVAVPVMALLLLFGPILLPEYRDRAAAHLDLASTALSLAATLAVVFGIKRLVQDGVAPLPLAAVAVGSALGIAFVRRQHTLANPYVDLSLFRRPTFTTPLVANALAFFVLYGTQFVMTQYLQQVLGLSALVAGLWTIPSALGYLLGSVVGPVAANRLPAATVLGGSLLVAAAGFAALSTIGARSGVGVLVVGSVVFSIGLAPAYIVATQLTMSSVPTRQAGAAAAVLETCTELGGAFGVAILGSIGAVAYHGRIGATAPAGVDAAAWDRARETLGGAVDVARSLPAGPGDGVLATARAAYVSAFQLIETIGAALLAGTAVTTFVLLRRRAPGR